MNSIDLQALSAEHLDVVVRLLGLATIPREQWTEEDAAFFRDVRKQVEKGINGGREEERDGGLARDLGTEQARPDGGEAGQLDGSSGEGG